jgi:hypothetical protein
MTVSYENRKYRADYDAGARAARDVLREAGFTSPAEFSRDASVRRPSDTGPTMGGRHRSYRPREGLRSDLPIRPSHLRRQQLRLARREAMR